MKYRSSLFAGILIVFLAGLFVPFDAYAGSNWLCKGGGTLNNIFCGITTQFRYTPKLLSTFSYVIAVYLGVTGLLQLKEYGDDPSKTPLRSIVIKLVLAAAMTSLPFTMQLFVTTVTGASSIEHSEGVSRPKLGGAGLSG